MRTEINYKKEGFTQIFPILYITNDKEKVWVFGFGNKNISFVSGENDDYNERLKNNEIKSSFIPFGIGTNKLNHKQLILLSVVGLAAFGVVYHFLKKSRNK